MGAKEMYPVTVNQVGRRISHPYLDFPSDFPQALSHGSPVGEGGYIDQPSR